MAIWKPAAMSDRESPSFHAVFGVSDLIEAQTGAWWEPWSLLVMKAACVLVFLLAWRAHRRQRRPHG